MKLSSALFQASALIFLTHFLQSQFRSLALCHPFNSINTNKLNRTEHFSMLYVWACAPLGCLDAISLSLSLALCVYNCSMSIVDDVYVWSIHTEILHTHTRSIGLFSFFQRAHTYSLVSASYTLVPDLVYVFCTFYSCIPVPNGLCFICWMCRMRENRFEECISASAFAAPGVFFHLLPRSLPTSIHLWFCACMYLCV